MQFRKKQRDQLRESWNTDSWFFRVSSATSKAVVEQAYGIQEVPAHRRTKAQEGLSIALALFARKTGSSKDQVIHALLTGSLPHLMSAMARVPGNTISEPLIREAWEESFREIYLG